MRCKIDKVSPLHSIPHSVIRCDCLVTRTLQAFAKILIGSRNDNACLERGINLWSEMIISLEQMFGNKNEKKKKCRRFQLKQTDDLSPLFCKYNCDDGVWCSIHAVRTAMMTSIEQFHTGQTYTQIWQTMSGLESQHPIKPARQIAANTIGNHAFNADQRAIEIWFGVESNDFWKCYLMRPKARFENPSHHHQNPVENQSKC